MKNLLFDIIPRILKEEVRTEIRFTLSSFLFAIYFQCYKCFRSIKLIIINLNYCISMNLFINRKAIIFDAGKEVDKR